MALLKLNKEIYIVISWNNGSAVLTLENDNQTLCSAVSMRFEYFIRLANVLTKTRKPSIA